MCVATAVDHSVYSSQKLVISFSIMIFPGQQKRARQNSAPNLQDNGNTLAKKPRDNNGVCTQQETFTTANNLQLADPVSFQDSGILLESSQTSVLSREHASKSQVE